MLLRHRYDSMGYQGRSPWLVSVLAHPVESWCQPEIAKPSLAHQSLTGKILSGMDLACSLRSVRPSGADCHDISVAEEARIGSLASRSDVRRKSDRGVGAVNFLGDKPSQGSARIPPDPQPQQSKI